MSSPDHIATFKEAEDGIDFKKEKLAGSRRWTYTCMMDGCHSLHKKGYEKRRFNKHLQEHPDIHKRQYTTIEKRRRKENCSTKVENIDDQILRFRQGFDENLNVLVAGHKKDKNQADLCEQTKQVTALKNQIEALQDQKEEKSDECYTAKLSLWKAEQLAAQLKREVESRRSEVLELGRDIEALKRDKDLFKEENDSLKSQVKKSADVISRVQLLESENVKLKGLEDQNQSLNDEVAQLKTECGKAEQARKDAEQALLESEDVKLKGLEDQNQSLNDEVAQLKTECGKAEQARKDAEQALKDRDLHITAFCTNMGFASPAGTSSRLTTPPAKKRKNEEGN